MQSQYITTLLILRSGFSEEVYRYDTPMYCMGTPWGKIHIEKTFKEFRKRTDQFVLDFETSLNDFEKKGDVKELISKLRDSVIQFQNETRDSTQIG